MNTLAYTLYQTKEFLENYKIKNRWIYSSNPDDPLVKPHFDKIKEYEDRILELETLIKDEYDKRQQDNIDNDFIDIQIELQKCIDNPYYFATKYVYDGHGIDIGDISEADFNKIFK